MAIQWTTTSQANADQGRKILVHSESGVGKTVLVATLPRPVLISAEAGTLSLSKANLDRLKAAGSFGPDVQLSYDIPVMQVRTMAQLKEAYMFFMQPQNRASEYFKSIALDSITEIAEVVLANAKVSNKDGRAAYGDMAEQVVQCIKDFRDLMGFHFYASSKTAPDKDAAGIVRFSPMMPGTKVGPQLPYLFDEVFAYRVSTTPQGVKYRALQTQPDYQYTAKDRSGLLDEMERPDLNYLINKMQGA